MRRKGKLIICSNTFNEKISVTITQMTGICMGLNHKYQTLMVTTRKALLDTFWSQEPGTIRRYISMLRKMIGVAKG